MGENQSSSTVGVEECRSIGQIMDLPLCRIRSGVFMQRDKIEGDDFDALCGSIRRVGVLIPIVVRADGDRYVLIAGHRRVAACQRIGLTTIPGIVRSDNDVQAAEVNFAENFFRTDLSPVELAASIKSAVNGGVFTVEALAEVMRHHPDWVRRQIALCDWPGDVLEAIHYRRLSVSAGANLAVVTDDVYRQFLVKCAVDNGATARTTAAWLQAWEASKPAEEAVKSEPVGPGQVSQPMVPQAPCISCSNIFRTDELSHVPMCGECIRELQGSRRH